MPALILPRRFGSRQPQQTPNVDRANPITRSLAFIGIPNGNIFIDAVTGARGTLTGASLPALANAVSGKSFLFGGGSATNSYVNFGTMATTADLRSAPMTFVVFSTPTGQGGLIERNDNNTVNAGFEFGIQSDLKVKFILEFSGTNTVARSTNAVTSGAAGSQAVSYDGVGLGSGVSFYINGAPETTVYDTAGGVGTVGSDAAQNFYIGRNTFASGTTSVGSMAGNIELVLVFKRVLSAGEIASLHRDRYQVFRNTSPRIVLPSSDVAFDAVANSGYQAAQSTYAFNRTCSGLDRFLAVDVSLLSAGQTVTSVIDDSGGGNVALTFIGAQSTVSSVGRVETWGLINPALGTKSIQVNLSGSITSAATAVSYTGVHQTVPTEAFNSAQATNDGAADATVSVTTVADKCWVHGAIATDDGSITANQTSRNNVTGAGGSAANEDNNGPKTPAGAVTVSYTGVGALATWAIAGYAIRPTTAAAGSSDTTVTSSQGQSASAVGSIGVAVTNTSAQGQSASAGASIAISAVITTSQGQSASAAAAVVSDAPVTVTQAQSTTSSSSVVSDTASTVAQGQTTASSAAVVSDAPAAASQAQSVSGVLVVDVMSDVVVATSQGQSASSSGSVGIAAVGATSQGQTASTVASVSVAAAATTSQGQTAGGVSGVAISADVAASQGQSAEAFSAPAGSSISITKQGQSAIAVAMVSDSTTQTSTQGQSASAAGSTGVAGVAITNQAQAVSVVASLSANGIGSTSQAQSASAVSSTGVAGASTASQAQSTTVMASVGITGIVAASQAQSTMSTLVAAYDLAAVTKQGQSAAGVIVLGVTPIAPNRNWWATVVSAQPSHLVVKLPRHLRG